MFLERTQRIITSSFEKTRFLTRNYKELMVGVNRDPALVLATRSATLTGTGILTAIIGAAVSNEIIPVVGLGMTLVGCGGSVKSFTRAAYGV